MELTFLHVHPSFLFFSKATHQLADSDTSTDQNIFLVYVARIFYYV
jgi:hypothetical protein